MKTNGGKLLLALLLALPAMGPYALAGSFAGAANTVLPGVVDSGGQDGASASHNLIGVIDEPGQSAYTSANNILQPGFANLVAWPERVSDLYASTGAAEGSVRLTWTSPKADGFTGTSAAYEVRLSSLPAKAPALSEGQFLLAGSVTDFVTVPAPAAFGSTEQLSVTGLVGGATYYFAVKARASWDAWSYLSNGATAQARLYAPAPAGFAGVTEAAVKFSWTDNANVPGTLYRVLVSTAPDPLNPAGAVVTSSDTYNLYLTTAGLIADTVYYFRAAGINSGSVPPVYSAAAATSTLVAFAPVFTGFSNFGAGIIQANWAANGNAYPDTQYKVLYSTAADPLNPAGADVGVSYTNNLFLAASGLSADTTYYFSVAGINHNGITTGYTSAAATSTLANAPVFASFANVDPVSIQFNWAANGNRDPGTLYRVAVSTAPDPLNPAGAAVTSSDTYNVFLDSSGLVSDTAYYFTAAAINNNGIVSNYMPTASVSTLHVVSPVFWAAGTSVSGTGTVTPAWPSHQKDDIALLFIESTGGQPATLTTPNGFAPVANSPQATGATTSGTQLTVFWARATSSSMASPLVAKAGNHEQAVILTFRYAIKSGNPWDVTGGGVKPAASVSAAIPSVITTGPGTLIVTGITKDVTGAAAFASGWTNTNLTNIITRFNAGSIAGNGGGIAVMTGNKSAVGDTGSTLVTVTSSINAFLTIALKPQPPLLPPNVTGITNVAARSIAAGWGLVSGATGYTLAASLAPDTPPAIYASSTTLGDLSATVDNPVLAPNTTYYLFVRSNGPGESSAWSAYPGTSTLLEYDPAFAGYTNISPDTIQLNWSANGNAAPGTLYRVLVSTAPNPLNPAGAVVTTSDTYNLSLSSSGLAADTVYNFGVAGINNNNVPTNYAVPQGTATLLANPPAFNNFTSVAADAIQFNWTANGNAYPGTHFRVLVSTAADPLAPAGAVVTTSDTYNLSLSSSGLAANTSYYFTVAGLNKNGILTSYTPLQSTSTLANAPLFANFSNVGSGAIRVNWTVNGNPNPGTAYRVLVSTAPDPLAPGGAVVTSSNTYNLSLSSSGLAANTTYYFRVAGVNNNNVLTSYAAVQSTSTLLANAPAFTNFTSVGAGSMQFNWSANGNAYPGTQFRVLVSTAPDPLAPSGAVVTSSDTYSLSLSSSGLAANTTYYFSVAGINNNNVATAYAVQQGTSTLLAFAPVFSSFTGVGAGAVQFNWTNGGNAPAVTRYRVAASTATDPLNPAGAVVTVSDTYNVSLVSSGLDPNTTYYFSAAGVNNNGVLTAYTSAAGTSTLAALPSGFDFPFISSATLRLSWSSSGNGPGTQYSVLASTAADPLAPAGAVVTTSATYNVFLATSGLQANRDYFFRAAAINNNGLSTSYSAIVTTKTLAAGVLAAPLAGAFTAYASSITANWTLVSGATGYTLAASVNPGNPPAPVYASSTTFIDSSAYVFAPALAADTVYYLFVRANGDGVSSSWSDYAPVATLLANPPVSSGFANVGTNSADFIWSANGNAPLATKYRVLVSTAPDPLAPAGAVVTTSDTYNVSLSSAGLAADTTYYFRTAGVNKDGVLTAYTAVQATATWANAPVFTNFSGVGAAAIQVNWSANGNPYPKTLYQVLVSTADPLSPSGAVVTASNTYNVSLSSSGLAANATYYFRVAGLGNNGSATAYTAAAGTSTLLAAAPVFTNFTNVTAASAQFNWSANGNAYPGTRFRVLVSTAPDPLSPSGAAVASSDTYNAALNSTGLAANTTYYVRAAGVNNNNVLTAYSAAAATATLASIPITALSTFSAVTDSGFTISWNNNSNPMPGTVYIVQASTAPDFNSGAGDQVTASTTPAAGPSYAFTGLSLFTTYYVQLRAVNRNGVYTGYTALGSTRTLSITAPVLTALAGVQTTAISASWQLTNGATGYTLAASLYPDNPPSPIYASSTTLGDLSAVINAPSLSPNTTYYLFVRSNGPGASSPWSAYPGTSTLAGLPLSAYATFSAVDFNSFSVSWDNNSNPLPGTLYTVQVSTAYDFNPGVVDQVTFTTAPAAGPGATFTGLNVDTWYYFRVRAVNNNGIPTDYAAMGVVKTKALPVLHSAGDGVIFYGQAGNTTPQFRNYYGAGNSFSGVQSSVSGAAGSLFMIKTNPLTSKQEAVAGYVKDGTLHMLCTDGTNWSEDWTQFVGGNETTRRFDISYETNSGDVMVLYSQNAAGANALGYRTKPGGADCGSASWSGNINLSPARTSGVVQWVKMASDRRTAYNDVAAIWADSNRALSAMVWTGTAWENEPSAALETSLGVVSVGQDVEDFDVEFESLSGNIMVVWDNSAGNNGVNGVRYARAIWSGGTPLHTWGAATTPPTFLDDAINLDLAANPNTNEMVFASLGIAGAGLQAGYWSGSAWTDQANKDTSHRVPAAGTKLVAAGWLTSGATSRSVVAYADVTGPTLIGWYVGSGGTFTAQTDVTAAPAFGDPQKYYDIEPDPVNKDRLMFTVSDFNNNLFAKRLVMTSVPAFTWTDANSASQLEMNLASSTVGGYSFVYWPAPPTTTFAQSAYRFFNNTDTTDVGTPLASQDTLAQLPSAGSAFRLRTLLHVGQVDLPINGQGFKLQFAGKGDGTCAAPSGGVPAAYADVTNSTLIAFKDNSPADNAALTPNANDPKHGAHTTVSQTYSELNNSTNTAAAIARNQDGEWDFALKDNGVAAGTSYCFRLVKGDGSELNSYDVYPEVILPAPVYINEVYPTGATAADDWVELYNNTTSTPSLVGWKLEYVENTIDLGGTPNTVWTGLAGDVINAMSTFTIANPAMNLNGGLSYHVKLRNNAAGLVDQVQWPVMGAGQSFARITDGDPSFFEIDPTPTKGYANHVATDTLKINEVAYGPLNAQFIEIYNTSVTSTRTLAGYSLRNSAASANGLKFRFTKKIYPQNYAVLDFSSISDDALSYTYVFGAQGLSAAGDFLALEDPSGSMVDNVTWQSDINYTRYNYRAVLSPMVNFAPANTASSIMRQPAEGSDTGNNASDFRASALATLGSRNNTAGTAAANTLTYPLNTGSPQFLARKFPLTVRLGAVSSSATANNMIFERTGGSADARSPHLYRLQDIGLDLQSLAVQTTVQAGLSFKDQDGYPLVDSATYRVTFNSDTGAQSAPQLILGTVTFDASIHSVTGSSNAPANQNNAVRGSAIRLDISNNSPAGFNSLEVTTVTFKLMNSDLSGALTTAQARNLFNAVMLVRDSTSTGVYGIYESAIDVSTIAYVPMASISLDGAGMSTLTVLSPDLPSASIPAGSTTTFYVVFEATQNASGWTPNVFRVRFDPAGVAVRDGPSGLREDFVPSSQVDTSSTNLMAPALPPAGTVWPYASPTAAAIGSPAASYINTGDTAVSSSVYVSSNDGHLRALNKDGSLKWSYATDSLTPIHTSPMPVVESGALYIYFADDNGDIYKVSDDNSAAGIKWKKSIGAPIKSSLMCSDQSCSGDVFYFGAADNKVHCLNKADGTPCTGWNYASAITAPISGTLSIDARATITTGWTGLEDGKMVSFKTGDGTSNTVFQTGAAIKSSSYLDAAYGAANNNLYFTSTDGKLYSRTSANLTAIPTGWTDYNSGSPIYTSPWVTSGSPKYVFFGDDGGRLRKVDAASGALVWTFQAGGAIRSSPVVVPGAWVGLAQDYLYFGCDDGYIYGVDANTGALRSGWPVATGGPVRADPVTDLSDADPGKRVLVVGSNDGKTYTLNIGP